jgi:hypothetical protein
MGVDIGIKRVTKKRRGMGDAKGSRDSGKKKGLLVAKVKGKAGGWRATIRKPKSS